MRLDNFLKIIFEIYCIINKFLHLILLTGTLNLHLNFIKAYVIFRVIINAYFYFLIIRFMYLYLLFVIVFLISIMRYLV